MDNLLFAGNKTLQLALLLSALPVVVATVIGLLVGLLQTVTQLQEQTLPFGVKLLAVVICLLLTTGWYGEHLLNFAEQTMRFALSR
ncbi:EscS/YscS/HrcS family type III secretion system export apparatus protein [Herbaspirillum sp. RTI4]|uniref:EscS/YscS/HrcS family type III secretion system export apparatus protein n=1 Tax=Herbaspirillum sp. RTI4 TaxID=3048640 RepID=UPI002AB54E4A|nr:EscS/YscS/HrcS family type III secretion system export apparatus protein [Herbaspirillum sp. RTI4]MDY7578372.1 EscS/YscS/HrcS family type III secretion system export apparatus protein [Herbaspirillum sp. RTI4]MEA9983512.1 EscS/YscS/HrcS family type III secretion system export apparatus protein [Herbaspirillum sp. RTI4]